MYKFTHVSEERPASISYRRHLSQIEVGVTLRLTVSQPICLGIEYPCGTCDQILFPVGMYNRRRNHIYIELRDDSVIFSLILYVSAEDRW
jgi:hypothetical protein